MALDVLSPDGIPIDAHETYPTHAAAESALAAWVKRYEWQGFYSTARWERIPLDDLAGRCRIVEAPEDDDEDMDDLLGTRREGVMRSFPCGFNKYACAGDTISVAFGDVTVTATIEFDQDSKPSDYECYSEEHARRWSNDEWFYCGIVLSVRVGSLVVSPHEESLWGIEVNIGPNNDYLTEVATDMLRRVDFNAVARDVNAAAQSLRDAAATPVVA